MSIRIEEINVRDLGPLKGEHSFPLDTFNLIYGKNERGKTFLVEFILRSLFRSSKGWRLRDFSVDGKVLLSGINEDTTEFSPDSRLKLEDYLEDAQPGLPMDLAKLLVVRGAELSLVKDKLVDRTHVTPREGELPFAERAGFITALSHDAGPGRVLLGIKKGAATLDFPVIHITVSGGILPRH